MTFIEFILVVIIIGAAVFVVYKMKRDSSDMVRGQLELHRERQRAIKGNDTKKD